MTPGPDETDQNSWLGRAVDDGQKPISNPKLAAPETDDEACWPGWAGRKRLCLNKQKTLLTGTTCT